MQTSSDFIKTSMQLLMKNEKVSGCIFCRIFDKNYPFEILCKLAGFTTDFPPYSKFEYLNEKTF